MAEIPKIVLEERPATTCTGQSEISSGQSVAQSDQDKGSPCISNASAKHKRSQASNSADCKEKEDGGGSKLDNDDDSDDACEDERRDSVSLTPGHMPIRSSSDIGLPATSMPNLALSMMSGGGAGGEGHLGVYCSPRASRRSVDLEVTGCREDCRPGDFQYDWSSQYEGLSFHAAGSSFAGSSNAGSGCGGNNNNSSSNNNNNNNTLRVLTSSSRAASALSLTSDCTARSIGLLSNDGDSDSDADASLMSDAGQGQGQGQGQLMSSRDSKTGGGGGGAAQLRRYLSHPEESVAPPTSASDHVGHARPSVSLINIKCAEASLADPVDTTRPRTGNEVKVKVTEATNATTAVDHSAETAVNVSENSAAGSTEVGKNSSSSQSNATGVTLNDTKIDNTARGDTKTSTTSTASSKPKRVENDGKIRSRKDVEDTGAACYSGSKETFNSIPPSLQDGSLHTRTGRTDREERITFSVGGAGIPSSSERAGQKILSYKCDAHDNSRNGRIRQWLQDMDKLDLSNK